MPLTRPQPTPTTAARLLDALPVADQAAIEQVRGRERRLTKPAGALGRLEEITEWLAGWQGRYPPQLRRLEACVFAGNHGVVAHGVSAYPATVTSQMLGNFAAGGAAVNRLCRTFDVRLRTWPLSLDRPAFDFTGGPSPSEAEFSQSFSVGMDAAEEGIDILCLGEMGIGNTTAAAAALEVAHPGELDHCRVAHVSAEPGHRLLLRRLGVRPLLDLDMRLGEASGAVLAVALVRAAVACHLGMATFDDAGVTNRDVG
jgi:nicotinate-nucleotide--dimethylbenzimidazole phosphoribosyltransferase